MINLERMNIIKFYKVVCKVEHSGKFEIVTRIWTKSEYELIKKNKYYLA